MSSQVRNELLHDLKELQRLEAASQAYSFAPSYHQPFVSSQVYSPPPLYPQPQSRLPVPVSQPLVSSQLLPQRVLPPLATSNVWGGPLAQPVQQNLASSRVLSGPLVSQPAPVQVSGLRESIKGESYFEYVPFEKVYYEQEEHRKVEKVEVAKKRTDYYAVEKQVRSFLSFYFHFRLG